MTVLVIAVAGSVIGVGLLLVGVGARGQVALRAPARGRTNAIAHVDRLLVRSGLALAVGVVVGSLTGWVAAAVAAGGAGAVAPSWWSARGRHQREVALVDAIAGWTEQLRDTLAAANGIESAIVASAPLAPAPIAGPVSRLAARLEYEPLSTALRRFGDDVDDGAADFVVAALMVIADHEAREVGALLGQLAAAARDEARMRTRVWVGRARTRSAVRIIVGVVLTFVAGLLLLDRQYLAPYDGFEGQVALLVIAALFAGSFLAMDRMGRFAVPARIVAPRQTRRVP